MGPVISDRVAGVATHLIEPNEAPHVVTTINIFLPPRWVGAGMDPSPYAFIARGDYGRHISRRNGKLESE